MNNKIIIGLIVAAIILIAFPSLLKRFATESPTSGTSTAPFISSGYDITAFAQCLADKKVTMYGAVWCSHCQKQKALFGDAFKLVPYVECPDNPSACVAAGINGYPTWVFANGTKLEGEQSFQALSRQSSCPLVKPETAASE